MNNDTANFMGKSYGLRALDFGGEWGVLSVASHDLNALLIDDSGQYTSNEAQTLDEGIFYFIAPAEFGLSDELLTTKILREIK